MRHRFDIQLARSYTPDVTSGTCAAKRDGKQGDQTRRLQRRRTGGHYVAIEYLSRGHREGAAEHMDRGLEKQVLVLSADDGWNDRALHLCSRIPGVIVQVYSDPSELLRALTLNRQPPTSIRIPSNPAGLVLDLSFPNEVSATYERTSESRAERVVAATRTLDTNALSWYVEAIAAVLAMPLQVPLAVVSADTRVQTAFRYSRADWIEHMYPNEPNAAWEAAIVRMTQLEAGSSTAGWNEITAQPHHSKGTLRLSGGIGLDLQLGQLYNGRETVLLTGRELRVLEILASNPRRFCSASELARRAKGPLQDEIDEHCIEQAIYELRRKLGECARRPKTLISRRGVGYKLVFAE